MTFTLGGGLFGFRIGLALIVASVSLAITPVQAASRTPAPATAARKAPEPSRKPLAQLKPLASAKLLIASIFSLYSAD